jgi:hypothetical protein
VVHHLLLRQIIGEFLLLALLVLLQLKRAFQVLAEAVVEVHQLLLAVWGLRVVEVVTLLAETDSTLQQE